MALLVFVLGMGGAIALLLWYQNTIWGPATKRKLMRQGSLPELQKFGFRATDQAFELELTGQERAVAVGFIGTVDGYATEVSFGWTDRPHILVRVFFDPGSREYAAVMAAWQELPTRASYFGQGIFIAPVYADATMPYNFSPPSTEQILRTAAVVANYMRELGKNPLDYSVGCQLARQILEEKPGTNKRNG